MDNKIIFLNRDGVINFDPIGDYIKTPDEPAPKILIIDDDDDIRAMMKRSLSSMKVEVLEADDGQQGITTMARTKDLKLVITDIKMPNMDGLTLIEKAKEMPQFRDVPFIVVTGFASNENLERAKKLDLADWITKPFDVERLVGAVGRALNPSPG